jgi:hypothetical protein
MSLMYVLKLAHRVAAALSLASYVHAIDAIVDAIVGIEGVGMEGVGGS